MKNLVRTLCADLRKIRKGDGWKQWLSALVINQSFKTIVLYRLTHACRCKPLHLIVGGQNVSMLPFMVFISRTMLR